MKKIIIFILITVIKGYSQSLTITDLEKLSNIATFSQRESFLLDKKFEFDNNIVSGATTFSRFKKGEVIIGNLVGDEEAVSWQFEKPKAATFYTLKNIEYYRKIKNQISQKYVYQSEKLNQSNETVIIYTNPNFKINITVSRESPKIYWIDIYPKE